MRCVIAHFSPDTHNIAKKGGITLAATGYIQVHAYTSNAQIPLKDVAVAITEPSGSAIALRLTDRSGQFTEPVPLTVPEFSASQTPNTGVIPYRLVNLHAKLPNYEEIEINNLQVFANTITTQNLELIPLSELPEYWNQVEIFNTPVQNL